MDLLSAIKAIDPDVPVVVMTAWATMETAIEAMRRGASDFIQKPWNNPQVLDVIRAQVERRRSQLHELRSRKNELDDARCVQQALLPRVFPDLPGFELAAWSRPVSEIGGDYYDIIKVNDRTAAIIVADASGKGIPAALVISNLRGALRALAAEEPSPAGLCRKVNRLLSVSLPAGHFVTFFCALLDLDSGRLRFCSAGHQPCLAITTNGIIRLQTGGAVLGHFEDWSYEDGSVTLAPGDSVLLFTDGILEARDPQGTEFEERGILAAAQKGAPGAHSLLDAVTAEVTRHCRGRFEDDATLLVLRRNPLA